MRIAAYDLRDFEWYYLQRLAYHPKLTVLPQS